MTRYAPPLQANDDSAPFPLNDKIWRHVAAKMQLSPQQKRIVEMLLQGKKCKQIGPALGLSNSTVETYLKRIYSKLGVPDHTGLLLHIMTISHQCSIRSKRPDKS